MITPLLPFTCEESVPLMGANLGSGCALLSSEEKLTLGQVCGTILQSEWQFWEMGFYPGGHGEPWKVSEQSIGDPRPQRRKEATTLAQGGWRQH